MYKPNYIIIQLYFIKAPITEVIPAIHLYIYTIQKKKLLTALID